MLASGLVYPLVHKKKNLIHIVIHGSFLLFFLPVFLVVDSPNQKTYTFPRPLLITTTNRIY